MPILCLHCHKMVPEQPTCVNCGKKLKLGIPKSGQVIDDDSARQLTFYVLKWLLGFVGVALLCILLLYFFLLR